MASDVTYLFFRRDDNAQDNGPIGISPTIKTTRVRQVSVGPGGARLRAGSLPPPQRKIVRGSSVPPAPLRPVVMTSSSETRTSHSPAVHQRSTMTTVHTVKPSGAVTSTRMRSVPPAATAYRRASISVIPGPPARPSAPTIYRADDFVSKRSSPTSSFAVNGYDPFPTRSSSLAAERSFGRGTSVPLPSASSPYRRSSVSVSRVPAASPRRSYASDFNDYQYQPVSPPPVRNYEVKATTTTDRKRFQDGPLQPASAKDFENQRESLDALRSRMNSAREQLSRHRVMLDRYLPVSLAQPNDVKYEVEYKVSELFPRMPQLDPNSKWRSTDNDHDQKSSVLLIAPYKPPPARQPKFELPPVRTPFFSPKVSDVRKRARNVLCKVKNDPHYFDY